MSYTKNNPHPSHVAIIMDGNRRWALSRGQEIFMGHDRGAENVIDIVKAAIDCQIKHLTLFALSTENIKRPKIEVKMLKEVIQRNLSLSTMDDMIKSDIRFKVVGDITILDQKTQDRISYLEESTLKNNGLHLSLCINYSGKMDFLHAALEIALKVKNENINLENITCQTIYDSLASKGLPDVDLLIRTSGEMRISNFLLWQLAYAELFFCKKLWPDFTKEDLIEAIEHYKLRDRRHGSN